MPSDPWRELDRRRAKLAGRPDKVVELRDPQAIRAVAHRARQQVIDVLFAAPERSFTATTLAELTGLSPSAMSYHLRALEKWGILERAEDAGDGRERPWRSAGTRLHIGGGNEPGGVAARSALLELTLSELRERMNAFRDWPEERRRSFVGTSQGEQWLTEEEAAHFVLAVERAWLEMLERGVRNEPGPGKVRTRFLYSLLPTQDERPPV